MSQPSEPPSSLWPPPMPASTEPFRPVRAYRRPGRLRFVLLFAIAIAIGAAGAMTAASVRVYGVLGDLQRARIAIAQRTIAQ